MRREAFHVSRITFRVSRIFSLFLLAAQYHSLKVA